MDSKQRAQAAARLCRGSVLGCFSAATAEGGAAAGSAAAAFWGRFLPRQEDVHHIDILRYYVLYMHVDEYIIQFVLRTYKYIQFGIRVNRD